MYRFQITLLALAIGASLSSPAYAGGSEDPEPTGDSLLEQVVSAFANEVRKRDAEPEEAPTATAATPAAPAPEPSMLFHMTSLQVAPALLYELGGEQETPMAPSALGALVDTPEELAAFYEANKDDIVARIRKEGITSDAVRYLESRRRFLVGETAEIGYRIGKWRNAGCHRSRTSECDALASEARIYNIRDDNWVRDLERRGGQPLVDAWIAVTDDLIDTLS